MVLRGRSFILVSVQHNGLWSHGCVLGAFGHNGLWSRGQSGAVVVLREEIQCTAGPYRQLVMFLMELLNHMGYRQ